MHLTYTDPRDIWYTRMYYDGAAILNDTQCSGSEDRITQCTRNGYGNFNCSRIAVAQCEGEKILVFVNCDVIRYALYSQFVNLALLKMAFELQQLGCST